MSEPRARIVEGRPWREAWERVPAEQRQRIDDAVRSGRGLEDPRDAALAVGLAVQKRTFATWGLVVAALIAVALIGAGTRETFGFGITAFAVIPLATAAWAHGRRSAALRAELHNRDVVYEAMARAAPLPPEQPVSDPWADVPSPPLSEAPATDAPTTEPADGGDAGPSQPPDPPA